MTLDLDAIRARFPALSITDGGRPRIYFDNPAGTQVPQSVVDAVSDCLLHSNANLGGHFPTSVRANAVVDGAHEAMADFLNAASARELIFGQNMTSLTFQISRSLGRRMRPGDEIVLSRMDHDANVTPWVLLARDLGLEVKWLDFDTDTYEFDLAKLDEVISSRTRLICVGHARNLLGTINDIRAIAERARATGALLYVDAVQSAPHLPIDVQALGCDFLVCSAYKFFGPHQGILWGREEVLDKLEPYKLRPAPNALPGRFETGTLSHEGMAGVTAAVEYFADVGRYSVHDPSTGGFTGRRRDVRAGLQTLAEYEMALARHLIDGLESLPGVTIRGVSESGAMHRRVPTVSFTRAGVHPADMEQTLAAENIFVWSGHSYALEPIAALGLTEKGGVLRVGLAHYNRVEEIDRLLEVIDGMRRARVAG